MFRHQIISNNNLMCVLIRVFDVKKKIYVVNSLDEQRESEIYK